MLSALQSRLTDPALYAAFCAEYARCMRELRSETNATRMVSKNELTKLANERDTLIQAIKDGVSASEVVDDLARNSARREAVEALLDGAERDPRCAVPIEPLPATGRGAGASTERR